MSAVHAVVLIQCEIDTIPEAAQAIAEIDGVSEVYSVTGQIDLIDVDRARAFDIELVEARRLHRTLEAAQGRRELRHLIVTQLPDFVLSGIRFE